MVTLVSLETFILEAQAMMHKRFVAPCGIWLAEQLFQLKSNIEINWNQCCLSEQLVTVKTLQS